MRPPCSGTFSNEDGGLYHESDGSDQCWSLRPHKKLSSDVQTRRAQRSNAHNSNLEGHVWEQYGYTVIQLVLLVLNPA